VIGREYRVALVTVGDPGGRLLDDLDATGGGDRRGLSEAGQPLGVPPYRPGDAAQHVLS